MINAPNDIWAVVESSISAFLVVSIDDCLLYVVLLHPSSKKALEPLGQKSADPSTDINLAERREKKDAHGREYPPYPNNPGPPRILMHNKSLEGEDQQWFETDCVLWHPTEHIMTAGGYLILYNYMIEWMYLHFFFWFVGGRLSKFCTFACEEAKDKNEIFEQISLVIGKVGPLSIVMIGLLLDIHSISKHVADRSRRIVQCVQRFGCLLTCLLEGSIGTAFAQTVSLMTTSLEQVHRFLYCCVCFSRDVFVSSMVDGRRRGGQQPALLGDELYALVLSLCVLPCRRCCNSHAEVRRSGEESF